MSYPFAIHPLSRTMAEPIFFTSAADYPVFGAKMSLFRNRLWHNLAQSYRSCISYCLWARGEFKSQRILLAAAQLLGFIPVSFDHCCYNTLTLNSRAPATAGGLEPEDGCRIGET